MAQSLCKNLVHLIFSTRHRRPYLSNTIRTDTHAYLGGILRELDSPPIVVGGVEDHVHALCLLSKNLAVATLIEKLKTGSSKWIKTRGPSFAQFHWQNGYGAFSVSQSNVESVRQYIADQPEHHRRKSFQEEFREFLQRHEIQYDESYLWD